MTNTERVLKEAEESLEVIGIDMAWIAKHCSEVAEKEVKVVYYCECGEHVNVNAEIERYPEGLYVNKYKSVHGKGTGPMIIYKCPKCGETCVD